MAKNVHRVFALSFHAAALRDLRSTFIAIFYTVFFTRPKLLFMKRRSFLRNATLSAFAISTSGFIRFDGTRYTGDCETTTDILGPFYRPGSPVKNNLVIPSGKGTLVELSGIIRHKDCTTPYAIAKIELWHCDGEGVYDNTSDEFRYRGTTYSDDKGFYSFKTILPVPYDVGNGHTRPAHFHLMFSAPGYQSLVTQLYFTGDPNISKDPSSASPTAKNRILDVESGSNGSKKVTFHVVMAEHLAAEPASINKLAGLYVNDKDKNDKVELFQKDNVLWIKNQVYGESLEYMGNNTFRTPGSPPGFESIIHFKIMPGNAVIATVDYVDDDKVKHTMAYTKS